MAVHFNMPGLCDNVVKMAPLRLMDYYNGKTLFVTGSSGFLGVILLEELLRICPGIKRIYILLRAKKGLEPQTRANSLFQKSVFDKLKKENPEALKKVSVCAGDVSEKNLGLSVKDLQTIYEEVNVVFHVAASISFLKPLRYILMHNAISTQYTVDLCRKIKNLDALVYTSTAFSNCNRDTVIDEEIYRMPFPAKKFVEVITKGTDEELSNLVSQCQPLWPNSYTFSKCLAENILLDNASDLPVAIVRPSLIITAWKQPVPGYLEDNSGITTISVGVGKGFIKVLHADPEVKFDFIPVDVSAHAHIIIAWRIATGRSPSHTVVNTTSYTVVTLRKYIDTMYNVLAKVPLPKTFRTPTALKIKKNYYSYWLTAAYEHYLPAVCIDAFLKLMGKKARLVSIYRFVDDAINSTSYFMSHSWKFKTDNFKLVMEDLEEEDKNLFGTAAEGVTLEELTLDMPSAAPFYQWECDEKTVPERLKVARNRYWLTNFIKSSAIIGFCSFAYIAVSQTLQLGYSFM